MHAHISAKVERVVTIVMTETDARNLRDKHVAFRDVRYTTSYYPGDVACYHLVQELDKVLGK